MPDGTCSSVSSAPMATARKGFYTLSVFSLICLLASLCVPSIAMYFVTAPIGWLCALAAVLVGVGKLVLNWRNAKAWKGMLLALLVLGAQTRFCGQVFWLWGRAIDGRPVSACNLKMVYEAMKHYVDQNREYPGSLADLTRSGEAASKMFISPFDPGFDGNAAAFDGMAATYSSYVYQPGKGQWRDDSRIILAYEYGAWYPTEFQLFPICGQLVLFGDGNVKLLEGTAFTEALRDDALRRRELGWPTERVRPVGEDFPVRGATTQAASAPGP